MNIIDIKREFGDYVKIVEIQCPQKLPILECNIECKSGFIEDDDKIAINVCCKLCGRRVECDFVEDECNSICRFDKKY